MLSVHVVIKTSLNMSLYLQTKIAIMKLDTELYFLVYHQNNGDIKACLFPNHLVSADNHKETHDSIALNTAAAVLKPLVRVQKGGGPRPWLHGAAIPSLALSSFCEIQSFILANTKPRKLQSWIPPTFTHFLFYCVHEKKKFCCAFHISDIGFRYHFISRFFGRRREKRRKKVHWRSDYKVTLHTQLAKYLWNLKDTIVKRQHIYIHIYTWIWVCVCTIHTHTQENKVSSLKSILFHNRFSQQPVYIPIYFS